MNPLLDWLRHGPLITDGAWGTEMQRRGLEAGQCPDLWNLAQPELVEEVACAYVEAGSAVILTNTFRANAISLGMEEEQVAAVNRAGVEISRRAAGGKAKVVASIGPTGKMLMTGEVSEEQVERAFTVQARALAEAGADALVLETFSDLEEASIALRAARTTGLAVIASFAFDSGKDKDRTMMGVTPEKAAERMEREGASAIGANCGAGPEAFASIATRFRDACELPIWVKPNAGLPEMVEGVIRYAATPESFATHLPALLDAGACFAGGCCGTSPAFIRALVEARRRCV
jgi:5-methyltetrahydrofolate--homocysteine methyltransferase